MHQTALKVPFQVGTYITGLIESILKRRTEAKNHEMDKIKLMKQALNDDDFMAYLHGLRMDSIALCYQIRTLDKNRLERYFG